MILTYRYRIYPTKAQAGFLRDQIHEACELYNAALQERRDAWRICRKLVGFREQSAQIAPMRADGCLTLVNHGVATDVLRRVDRAFKLFFARVRTGKRGGFPRFRAARRYKSIKFTHYGDGCALLDNGKLRVQGAGHIKLKLHRPLLGKPKTAIIHHDNDMWNVLFSVDQDTVPLPSADRAIGIDVGISNLVALSDGTCIANPRHSENAEPSLGRLHRSVGRKKRGSNRRRKAVARLAKAYGYVQRQREDFQHKLASGLVGRYGLIAIEDLNIQGLASSLLSKEVNNAGWSQLFEKLTYKAARAGRKLIRVDAHGTSQICICGAPVAKPLSQRWHSCKACGLSEDRDVVSAQVILQRARSAPSGVNEGDVIPCVA